MRLPLEVGVRPGPEGCAVATARRFRAHRLTHAGCDRPRPLEVLVHIREVLHQVCVGFQTLSLPLLLVGARIFQGEELGELSMAERRSLAVQTVRKPTGLCLLDQIKIPLEAKLHGVLDLRLGDVATTPFGDLSKCRHLVHVEASFAALHRLSFRSLDSPVERVAEPVQQLEVVTRLRRSWPFSLVQRRLPVVRSASAGEPPTYLVVSVFHVVQYASVQFRQVLLERMLPMRSANTPIAVEFSHQGYLLVHWLFFFLLWLNWLHRESGRFVLRCRPLVKNSQVLLQGASSRFNNVDNPVIAVTHFMQLVQL